MSSVQVQLYGLLRRLGEVELQLKASAVMSSLNWYSTSQRRYLEVFGCQKQICLIRCAAHAGDGRAHSLFPYSTK
jgi:hypothetical protein